MDVTCFFPKLNGPILFIIKKMLCCYITFTCLPRLLDLLKRTPPGKLFGFVQFAAFVVFFFSIFVFTKIRVRIFSEAFKSDERMRNVKTSLAGLENF